MYTGLVARISRHRESIALTRNQQRVVRLAEAHVNRVVWRKYGAP